MVSPAPGFDASLIGVLLKSFVFHRIARRFALMLLIIWVGATIMFFVPRQFGINPSKAGFFTPSPEIQRVRDLQHQLAQEYERLTASNSQDGTIDALEAEQERILRNLISDVDQRTTRTAFERQFGFGDPIIVQYGRYITSVARFDLGASRRFFPVTVFSVIGHSLYWTLGLMGVATVLSFAIGTLAGGLMGWPNSPRYLRWTFTPILAGSSIPYYLLGWILIWFLAFQWGLFPLNGGWDNFDPDLKPGWNLPFIISATHHSILPAFSVIIATAGLWTVTMRGLMVNMQGEDFMIFATAKGLDPKRIFLRYGLRNAILPQVTGLAASIGSLLSGVLLVELVFNYPGIGFLFWQSINQRDITMMTGIAFVVIVLLAVSMFLLDIFLPMLDRRIEEQPA